MDDLYPWSPSVCTELWRLLKHQGPLAGCFSFLGIGRKTMKNLWTGRDLLLVLRSDFLDSHKLLPKNPLHCLSSPEPYPLPFSANGRACSQGCCGQSSAATKLQTTFCRQLSPALQGDTFNDPPTGCTWNHGSKPYTCFPTHIHHNQIAFTH